MAMRIARLIAILTVALPTIGAAQDFPSLSFKVIGPPGNSPGYNAVVKPFWDETLPRLTGGKIKGELSDVLTLGLSGAEVFRLNRQGVTDFVSGSGTYASGDLPIIDGTDLTGVSQDIGTFKKVVDAFLPRISAEMERRTGVKVIGAFPTVGQVVFCNAQVNTLDDLKGKKVRVSGATLADFMRGLGATPVTMGFSEVIPAMQRKTIDCAVTGTTTGNTSKLVEVSTHLVPLLTGWSLNLTTVNLQRWQSLPPATRDFIQARLNDKMDADAWLLADKTTDHGIWCSVGDPRCVPDQGPGVQLGRYSLTLAKFTPADDERRKSIVREYVLPGFKQRCGVECAAAWNDAVGPVVGLKIQ